MTDSLSARLEELLAKATPGPYRAHDHEGMRVHGEDVSKWIGYAWVGRITKNSTEDGRWDAGWADMDRRQDGCKEYRERASADAHLIAEALNALPTLLSERSTLIAGMEEARGLLEPFAAFGSEWADDVPDQIVNQSDKGVAIRLADFRAARAYLTKEPNAPRHQGDS